MIAWARFPAPSFSYSFEMWVFVVESLMKRLREICETPRPFGEQVQDLLLPRRELGPWGDMRRRIASARSGAVNERGELAAWRAAITTSSAGASLGTKADAPASSAPKS